MGILGQRDVARRAAPSD